MSCIFRVSNFPYFHLGRSPSLCRLSSHNDWAAIEIERTLRLASASCLTSNTVGCAKLSEFMWTIKEAHSTKTLGDYSRGTNILFSFQNIRLCCFHAPSHAGQRHWILLLPSAFLPCWYRGDPRCCFELLDIRLTWTTGSSLRISSSEEEIEPQFYCLYYSRLLTFSRFIRAHFLCHADLRCSVISQKRTTNELLLILHARPRHSAKLFRLVSSDEMEFREQHIHDENYVIAIFLCANHSLHWSATPEQPSSRLIDAWGPSKIPRGSSDRRGCPFA